MARFRRVEPFSQQGGRRPQVEREELDQATRYQLSIEGGLERALRATTMVVARHRGGSLSATGHGLSEAAVLERAHGVVVVVPGEHR